MFKKTSTTTFQNRKKSQAKQPDSPQKTTEGLHEAADGKKFPCIEVEKKFTTMLTFNQFTSSVLPFTLKYEGGYANVANDKGGETYRGITRKNNPNWSAWPLVDKLKPKHNQILPALEPDVERFYWQRFLNLGLDKLKSTKVATAMFDYNVHGGFNLSVLRNIIASKFGKTIASGSELNWVNTQNEDSIASAIIEHRENYLKTIIAKDPTQKKFEVGWFKRLNALKTYINLKTVGIGTGVIFILIAIYFFIFYKKGQKK